MEQISVSVTEQVVQPMPVLNVRKTSRVLRFLRDWYAAQITLEKHWEKFSVTAAGKRVPYRVWSRYGAYLEVHQEND